MAFNKNAALPIAEYVVASSDVTTAAIGFVQTFTVTGALTSDKVMTKVIGNGSPLTSTLIAARVSASNTVELTLGTALALDVHIQVWRAA